MDTHGLWIIFDPNFKQIIKNDKNFYTILKDTTESVNSFKEGITDIKIIDEYLTIYIVNTIYQVIEQYYKYPNLDLILWIEDSFMYNNQLEYDLENEYGEFFLRFNQFYRDIITTVIVEELYKNKNIIEGTELDNSLIKYTNKTITETLKDYNIYDKICLGFPFIFLTTQVCEHKLFTDLNVCKFSGIINRLEDLHNKYYYKYDKIEKINNEYYELFNILYIINSSKSVCNILSLINKDSIEINDIINDLTITVASSNPISEIIYKNSSRDFITILEKSKICKTQEIIYTINYNKKLKNCINNCLNKFVVLDINIIHELGSHANALIYNPNTREVEIFEPKFSIETNKFELIYKKIVNDIFPSNVVYIPSKSYITHNIQDLQEKEFCTSELGHCASWTLWYIEHRLDYPKLTAKEAFEFIVKKYIVNINKKEESRKLTELIANYVQYIKKQRVTVLNNPNIESRIKELLAKEWGLMYSAG